MEAMTASNPKGPPRAENGSEKPNIFQRFWQKLDAKMQEKAEASASSCCCSDDEESDEKAGKKCC